MELQLTNAFIFDLESLINLFTAGFEELYTNTKHTFVLHESQDDSEALLTFLSTKPILIGFNNIEYDAQLLEYFIEKKGKVTANDIYLFSLGIIEREDKFDLPYAEWALTLKHIDVYKINHFDGKRVSLKWLEFSTRRPIVMDMPHPHDKPVPKTKIPKIVKYMGIDITNTKDFFFKCLPEIELRNELRERYKEYRVINMSDSSLGSFMFENILVKDYGMNKKELQKGSPIDQILVRDCLIEDIFFQSEVFQKVHETFYDMVITDVKSKGIKGTKYHQQALFKDMVFVYGTGGVHAVGPAGEYVSDDEYIIKSVDVASYYPNLAIANDFYPKHIGQIFCKIYKGVYEERKTHKKGTALNYAFKIALNAVYGKSNSAFSIFFDPTYTLKITINGQLLLTMLAEELANIGQLLMVNTDGIEVRIKREDEDKLNEICADWERLTSLQLEYNNYQKLVIRDVNNYIAIDEKGKAKRKGVFEIYYDYTEEDGKPHQYHKSPNATIIPQALFNYYAKDIPIDRTINDENNIYEFLIGIKKQKGFDHLLITAQPNGVVDVERYTDKVLRYYITPGGANVYKFWKDDRENSIQGINRGQLVKLAMNIRSEEICREKRIPKNKGGGIELIKNYNVDKQWYIDEAQKIVDLIASGERDQSYKRYMKKVKQEVSTEEE